MLALSIALPINPIDTGTLVYRQQRELETTLKVDALAWPWNVRNLFMFPELTAFVGGFIHLRNSSSFSQYY